MHTSQRGLKLIEAFEGFSSTPYWDAAGGVWTRGYGETEDITANSPAITRTQAETRLAALLASRYEPAIHALGIPLNQNQFDALASFVWNLGPAILTGQLRQALEQRNWQQAAQQMLDYDHAGGQVLEGLRRRREAEARLFLTPAAPYIPDDEARWEHEYDQLRGHNGPYARIRRRALQRRMRTRLINILHAAEQTGWTTRNRTQRYHKLLARL